jgi:anti-sigma-K factor RskA
MSGHLQAHLDLCAAYALGCLDAADRDALEAHLATGCTECDAALMEFSAATTLFAAATPPSQPPPALRRRVMDVARGSDATVEPRADTTWRAPVTALAPRRSSARWAWLAAAACLAVAVWGVHTTRQLRSQVEAQQTRVVALEHDRDQLASQLETSRRWVEVATASDARVAELAPTPDGNAALRGRAIVDPTTQRAAFAFSNLRPPAGHDYQLWAIRDGKPRSLGVLHADPDGLAFVSVDVGDPKSLQALAVSLEPAGGAPTPDQPTGPVVMIAKLSG